MTIESPSGTAVQLISAEKYLIPSGSLLDCIFDDDGTTLVSGAADLADGLEKLPSGSLSDFIFEVADGDWTINGSSDTFDTATLNDWCVAITEGCTAIPPSDVTCDATGGLDADLTWVNGGVYETIFIDMNGVEVAEVDGLETSVSITVTEADNYSVRLRAYDAVLDCVSGSSICSVDIGLVQICQDDPLSPDIISGVPVVETWTMDVVDDIPFEDVECLVDISIIFIDGLAISLENPDGTSVLMFNQLGSDGGGVDRMCCIYTDVGEINNFGTPDSSFGTCGTKIQPFALSNGATGAMADLGGGISGSVGDWIFEVDNVDGFYAGTLNEWCIRLLEGCTLGPITELECDALDDNKYPVSLTWLNDDPDGDYTEWRIARNGAPLITLFRDGKDGPAITEYSDLAGPSGQVVYSIAPYSEEKDCVKASPGDCLVAIGRVGICAADDPDFDAVTYPGGGDVLGISLFSWADDDLAAIDGTTDDDLSPDELLRVDIQDLQVSFDITTTFIGDWTISVASPEGTVLSLWTRCGSNSPSGEGDVILITDTGSVCPSTLPADCTEETCQFKPPVLSGEMADFRGEDAQGTWILVANTFYIGSVNDWCVYVFPDEFSEGGATYIRGDVDGSGNVSAIIDALRILQYFFGSAAVPPCWEAADVDGSGTISAIIDALRLLQHFFGPAPEPPAPFPACGRADVLYEFTGSETPVCETQTICAP
jgi:subtilisin-like proprotein convertase family protein